MKGEPIGELWSTFVLGSDGKVRDLGKREYLSGDVYAVNAWTDRVGFVYRKNELKEGVVR